MIRESELHEVNLGIVDSEIMADKRSLQYTGFRIVTPRNSVSAGGEDYNDAVEGTAWSSVVK